ncbi:helix-turn-helix domain-containing protein [Burkholderia gladioli]|uniref:helix-turn-helix domain-containing protein n=1 Tax=Burkholderia gladioli TaxID=28095 RepID=UPI001641FC98|nr:helix-turn-helix domain-containing protein [Burkholderia gladioli]
MNNILAIRRRLGIHQTDLAKLLGISQSGVSYYESGRGDPSIVVAHKLIEIAKDRGITLELADIYPESATAPVVGGAAASALTADSLNGESVALSAAQALVLMDLFRSVVKEMQRMKADEPARVRGA